MSYCSKICCMYTAKHTMLYKHKVHDGQAHVFYMDIRVRREGLRRVRPARPSSRTAPSTTAAGFSKITEENGKLIVRGADTLRASRSRSRPTWWCWPPRCARPTAWTELAQKLNVGYDENGFLSESPPQAATGGDQRRGRVHLPGPARRPKDIPEAVAQASAAAGKVGVLFAKARN